MNIDDEIHDLREQLADLRARLAPADPDEPLVVPDIVEFVASPDYLGLDLLYPQQLMMLKLHFGQVELLTEDDFAMLEKYCADFSEPVVDSDQPVLHFRGEHGIVPDVLRRIDAL